ncbi:MAG: CPBP family intramembrane metalloprotease [Mycobacteriaceae bacterium]|nr:CPBP family intramembrane metalloprotease [Mycobacteriaceae bacterium]
MTWSEVKDVAGTVAVPHHEPPAVVLRRRIVVAVVIVGGAVVLGFSMTRRPGDMSFYWLTFLLAAVWTVGAFVSGPLHLGCIRWRGRHQRPWLTGTAIGLLVAALFVAGGLVAREVGPVRALITRVLEYSDFGPLWLVVVITLVNGVAEELFFRGALYTALGRFYPGAVSTALYVAATLASGNVMLGFAAVVLGTVCALERRATGGVLAPVLTHLCWGLVMVLGLPPIFGV